MRPKILVTRAWPQNVIDHLRLRYEVSVNGDDNPLEHAALADAMRSCDALCPTVSDRIDASLLEAPGRTVQLLANYGAGCDHIDLEAARRAGIAVSNTPDVLTKATAELALLLMLMLSRRAGEGERELRSGCWTGWRPTHLMGQSLFGKVLGLVGFGRIAQATARLARSTFAMSIAYYSPRQVSVPSDLADAIHYSDLDTLLSEVDIVSLHCPGGQETFHLIDARRLALLKRSALLINTSRGTVIDEEALALALQAKRFAGAGLDVFESEPLCHPLLRDCENVVLLPHLGSATLETRTAMGMRVVANLDAFFAGGAVPDRVV